MAAMDPEPILGMMQGGNIPWMDWLRFLYLHFVSAFPRGKANVRKCVQKFTHFPLASHLWVGSLFLFFKQPQDSFVILYINDCFPSA